MVDLLQARSEDPVQHWPSAISSKLLGRSFERMTEPRHGRFWSEQPQYSCLLDHPMSQDERINNVPTGHASPSLHPHRNTALLHVDQVIGNHKTVTSCALHRALLCSLRGSRRHATPLLDSKRVTSRVLVTQGNRNATAVTATACVFRR